MHICSRAPQFPVCLPHQLPTPSAKPCFLPFFPGVLIANTLRAPQLHLSSCLWRCPQDTWNAFSPSSLVSYATWKKQATTSFSVVKCYLFCEGFWLPQRRIHWSSLVPYTTCLCVCVCVHTHTNRHVYTSTYRIYAACIEYTHMPVSMIYSVHILLSLYGYPLLHWLCTFTTSLDWKRQKHQRCLTCLCYCSGSPSTRKRKEGRNWGGGEGVRRDRRRQKKEPGRFAQISTEAEKRLQKVEECR